MGSLVDTEVASYYLKVNLKFVYFACCGRMSNQSTYMYDFMKYFSKSLQAVA